MAHSNPRNALGKAPAGATSSQSHWKQMCLSFYSFL